MTEFRQALSEFKRHLVTCLIIGSVSTFAIYAANFAPYISAFLISMILLIAEDACLIKVFKPSQLFFVINFRKKPSAFFSTNLLLLPTIMLCGSGIGLLESPNNPLMNISGSIILFLTSLMFYFLLTQSFRLHCETDIKFFKSLDQVGLAMLKNFSSYLFVGLLFSIGFVFSDWSRGILLIPLLPLLHLSNYFLSKKISA